MRILLSLALLLGLVLPGLAQQPVTVTANPTTARLVAPTNFFASNLIAGVNVTLTKGAGGAVTIASTGGGGGTGSIVGATNIGMATANAAGLVRGTNGNLIEVYSLVAGNNVTITTNGTNVTITSAIQSGGGIENLNGQTGVNQTFGIGNTGADLSVVSSGNHHEWRIPNSSPTSRGVLQAGDFNTLMNKQGGSTVLSNIVGAGGAVTNVNGLTVGTQNLLVGSAGTDAAWSSAGSTHTLNIPTASPANTRGLLAGGDYGSFAGRQGGSAMLTNLSATGAITNLNGQTGDSQSFGLGTIGADVSISSAGNVHTFNFPNASATARGVLSIDTFTNFSARQGGSSKLTNLVNNNSWTNDLTVSGALSVTNGQGRITIRSTNGNSITLAVTNAQSTNIWLQFPDAPREGLWWFHKSSPTNLDVETIEGGGVGQVLARTATSASWSNVMAGAVTNLIAGNSAIIISEGSTIHGATNSFNTEGVLPRGSGNPNRVWRTDANESPGYGQLTSAHIIAPGTNGQVIYNKNNTLVATNGLAFDETDGFLTATGGFRGMLIELTGTNGGEVVLGDFDQSVYLTLRPASVMTTNYSMLFMTNAQEGYIYSKLNAFGNIQLDYRTSVVSSASTTLTNHTALWVQSALLPTANPAALDRGTNDLWRLLFDDTTAEFAMWQFPLPSNYKTNCTITGIYSTLASAASRTNTFKLACQVIHPTASVTVNANNYNTTNSLRVAIPSTAGFPGTFTIDAGISNAVAGDLVKILLWRDPADANDNNTGDSAIHSLRAEYQTQ